MRQDDVLVRAIQEVIGSDADRLAQEHGLSRRSGKLSGGAFARTLVLSYLRQPDATLDQIAQTAALVAEPVTPQAIDQRFTSQAAAHLKACLEAAVGRILPAEEVAATKLFERFTEVCVQDSTTLELPDEFESIYRGCGCSIPSVANSALKFQVRFELKRGGLSRFAIEPGRAADVATPLQTEAIAAGSLHLRDLGYFDLSVFRTIDSEKAYFLSRLHQPIVVFDLAGCRRELAQWLDRHKTAVVDLNVTLGLADRMPARLIAIRVPRRVWRRRLKELRRQGSKKGYTPSPQRIALCRWNVYITNLPPTLLTVEEAQALIRLRWQIELLFKQWKSQGRLDQSRSNRPERILAELFAKMLALVIQHWILTRCCWRFANRSLNRASRAVQCLAGAMAAAWQNATQLATLFQQIARALERTGRVERRRKQPSAFQVIDNPKGYAYKNNSRA
jgi:DDE family transposase